MSESEGSGTEHFRMFIAVAIPEEVKSEIAKTQDELKRVLAQSRVAWTKREQFHLTLKFLGDVEKGRVPSLIERVRETCGGFPAMRVRSEHVGFFPDARFPRVVWVKIQDAEEQLPRLQAAIEAATRDFTSKEPEKKFSGHVTLGRIKGIKHAQAKILAEQVSRMSARVFGEWMVEGIEVMRSELSSAGARHSCLASIPLMG
jgi:2'-5' RNA ligase